MKTGITTSDSEAGIACSDLFAGFDPDEHEMLTMDGYDDCIVGVVERYGQNPIVCYDKEKVIQRQESDGMEKDEAEEFFYFNQIGAWMGESTPCFLSANVKDEEPAKTGFSPSLCCANLPDWVNDQDCQGVQCTSLQDFQIWLQEVYKRNQSCVRHKIRDMFLRPICRYVGRFLCWFHRYFLRPSSRLGILGMRALDYGYGYVYAAVGGLPRPVSYLEL